MLLFHISHTNTKHVIELYMKNVNESIASKYNNRDIDISVFSNVKSLVSQTRLIPRISSLYIDPKGISL